MTARPPPYGTVDGEPTGTPSEADIPTPPRGIPTVPPMTADRGPRRDRARIATVIALVLGLVGTAWVSTDFLRTTWRSAEARVAVAVDDDGVASLAGVAVSLVEAVDLGGAPSLPGSDWQPPDGFHAWRVVLETSSTNEDVTTCDVALVDDRGREFVANQFVDSFVDGYEFSYTCGVIGPDDDTGPQQALLVLVPADATPVSVQIASFTFNPDYIELPVG